MEALLSLFGNGSGLLGILGGVGGAIVRFMAAKQAQAARRDEMAHEISLLKEQAQMEERRAILSQQAAKALNEQQLAVLTTQGELDRDKIDAGNWPQSLTDQLRATGVKWIDALNSSVRPVLTYWWCIGIYTAAKVALLAALFTPAALPSAEQVASVLMTEFDKAVIASLIGFWFVDRALRRAN